MRFSAMIAVWNRRLSEHGWHNGATQCGSERYLTPALPAITSIPAMPVAVKITHMSHILVFYNSFDNIGLVRILSFLKSHNTEYLSGQDLSEVLKISRVAVWKHMRTIRELGYEIEARQKLGYMLIGGTDRLLPWEVSSGLNTRRMGQRVYYFDEIYSTQDYAAGLDAPDGTVVIAESQTHGRGRMRRKWESPRGGIWLSIVLRPEFDASLLPLIPLAVGVSLAESIKECTSADPQLKWPNDITILSKKVAGIVADASIESGVITQVIVGVGINFDIDVKHAQALLKKTLNFYGITSVISHDKNADRLRLVRVFLEAVERYMFMLQSGKTRTILGRWTRLSSTIGSRVSAIHDKKRITGTALRVDPDGCLVIKTADGRIRVAADDVMHLRASR